MARDPVLSLRKKRVGSHTSPFAQGDLVTQMTIKTGVVLAAMPQRHIVVVIEKDPFGDTRESPEHSSHRFLGCTEAFYSLKSAHLLPSPRFLRSKKK